MENKFTIVTIIPARGGSKGIKKKNIRLLVDKPLIYYSIKPSLNSKLVDYTFVSTEDEEIAEISKNLGSRIIKRPLELAQDNTPDLPVLQHAIKYLDNININPDIIVFLRPTQPFRTTEDIDNSIKKIISTNAGSVHTVHLVKKSPYWMNKIEEKDILKDFIPGGWEFQRRQDLPKVYKSNGLVDVMTRDLIMKEGKKRCPFNQRAIIIDSNRAIDIDTEFDFFIAEKYLEKK